MSGGRYMLDTDILVYVLRGLKTPNARSEARKRAERIHARIERELRDGATVYVSMVTVCELEYGSERALDPEKERHALYKILAPFELMGGDAVNLPRHYGRIRRELELAGQLIGAMDLMIAAHARAMGVTLVTNNVREFDRIQGLRVANWADG
jgi:tRNA(fMet)-specific endonuclease VapC